MNFYMLSQTTFVGGGMLAWRKSVRLVRMSLFWVTTRDLRGSPSRLSAPVPPSRRQEADVADCLGRESQFFVGSCVFGPMIYEARAILGMQSMTHQPGRIRNAPRL